MRSIQKGRLAKFVGRVFQLVPKVMVEPRLIPLMYAGVHPEHYLRLNVEWLRDSNIHTVLDIGANVGQFASAIRTVLPDAKVYAFEPLPECVDRLKIRFADDEQVEILPLAIGDNDGEVTFHQNAYSQSSSILDLGELHRTSRPWAVETRPIKVEMRSLDSLFTDLTLVPNILVKIDVQGFEDRVLRGGSEVVRRSHIVLVETAYEPLYEGEPSYDDIYMILREFGFRFAGNLNQALSSTDGHPIFADAVFVRADR